MGVNPELDDQPSCESEVVACIDQNNKDEAGWNENLARYGSHCGGEGRRGGGVDKMGLVC
jgi:hypothetical protein